MTTATEPVVSHPDILVIDIVVGLVSVGVDIVHRHRVESIDAAEPVSQLENGTK